MTKKTYMSRGAASKHLAIFYRNTPTDYVSREDLLIAAGKDPGDSKDYHKWFGYMMTAMGEYRLFTKVNGTLPSGQSGIIGIRLTEEGKDALGRKSLPEVRASSFVKVPGYVKPAPEAPRHVTVSGVRQDVDRLRQLEPELAIEFSVKLKEKPMKQR